MRTKVWVGALLLAATAALAQPAQPTITSISPNTVPVVGGTTVVIKGTGFSRACLICSPPCLDCATPFVFFGGTPAAQVKSIDSATLEVVTPPLMPGTLDVSVSTREPSGATLVNALTVTGDPLTAFEPLLFPVFLPPLHGQFGSEFHTEARAWNKAGNRQLMIYGVDTTCYLFTPVRPLSDPTVLPVGGQEATLLTGCSQTTGRILYTPRDDARFVALGLRVLDTSRLAINGGTEIPVVRERGFTTDGIALLNVPVRPNFRNMLRIYALSRSDELVMVTIGNQATVVKLTAGRNEFEPAYGELTDFRISPIPEQTSATVRIGYPAITSPGFLKAPLWAFVTSTNIDTQQITTVTPN